MELTPTPLSRASASEWSSLAGPEVADDAEWSPARACGGPTRAHCVGCVDARGRSCGPPGEQQRGKAISPPQMFFLARFLVRAVAAEPPSPETPEWYTARVAPV